MKITESINHFNNKKNYSISLKQEDNLEEEEIAECFRKQYPKKVCVISFSRIILIEGGLIIIGLKNEK